MGRRINHVRIFQERAFVRPTALHQKQPLRLDKLDDLTASSATVCGLQKYLPANYC